MRDYNTVRVCVYKNAVDMSDLARLQWSCAFIQWPAIFLNETERPLKMAPAGCPPTPACNSYRAGASNERKWLSRPTLYTLHMTPPFPPVISSNRPFKSHIPTNKGRRHALWKSHFHRQFSFFPIIFIFCQITLGKKEKEKSLT